MRETTYILEKESIEIGLKIAWIILIFVYG